ncbi:hypothetical protein J2X20_001288 [Pelomonas saccharophila]|uniref:Uncharacterized protein n=1 Tax=Roseateles saccharophilus TaxID=304 RepID=A0ABU1YII3_ROSSA|nr:hypothetical protein [Roseateles saccharophilus]MDR7268659.1 hypothetical protein [Roseateles saccharophilus]
MKLAAEPGCAALFEPPAVGQALLEVQAAVALARAEAGLQSWASAREVEAARHLPDPLSQELLDVALLMQTRRALRLLEAQALATAQALLALADARDPSRLPRAWLALGLGLLLGGIEPLRRAAAGLQLPLGGDKAVAAILARNLGLALPQAGRPGPGPGPGLLIDACRSVAALEQALQRIGPGEAPAQPTLPDEAEAERLLAHWRHRLPHLLPQAYGHEDPRLPPE